MESNANRRNRMLFFAVFAASLAFSAVYLALRRGEGLVDFFYQRGTNLLGDFVNNLHYPTHEKGPYFDSIWATFPPLAYTVYYLVNVCFTRAVPNVEIVAYIALTCVSVVLTLYAAQRIFERYGAAKSNAAALPFTLCILLSGVSLYTLERGNSVFNVMVMLLFFLYLRDAEEAWKREAALLILAVAAGFKIYPCVFGVIYLLEKRYREAVRLLIYGVVFFFVPFAWFGGVDGLKQFLYNQQQIHLLQRNDFLTSIPSVFRFCAAEFGWNAAVIGGVGQAAAVVFGVAAMACACLAKSLWQRGLLLMSAVMLTPGWSAEYMALYFVVPCALFLCQDTADAGSARYAVYAALFGGVFILLPFGAGLGFHAPVSWGMLVSILCVYLISFLAMGDVLWQRVSSRHFPGRMGNVSQNR